MQATAEQIERSGELKRQLLDFSESSRFRQAFRRALAEAEQRNGGPIFDEMAYVAFVDTFALRHRLKDDRTVIDHFLAAHPELSQSDITMVRAWQDYVDGVFEVEGRDGDALVTVNLVDGLTYRVRSNMGLAGLRLMPKRSFVFTRIVPLADDWFISGLSRVLPKKDKREVYQAAEQMSLLNPRLVFRNPDRLARGWDLQREDRERFMTFFGTDEVVLTGEEARTRMRAYWRSSAAGERHPMSYQSEEVFESATVGIMYPETEGLIMLGEYGAVREAFDDPELIRDKSHRRSVREYLKDDTVPPVVFRRLADRDPGKASRVFQLLLNTPGFDWCTDGEAVLRRHKPGYFDQPRYPSIVPICERVAKFLHR